jgi:two-component system response regulator YesN
MTRIGLASLIQSAGRGLFQVVGEADNGKTALELIEATRPHIVFTDMKMPVMDGIGLIEQAKAKGLKARFIVLSAYSDYDLVRRAMLAGADDYLLKMDVDDGVMAIVLNGLIQRIRKDDQSALPDQLSPVDAPILEPFSTLKQDMSVLINEQTDGRYSGGDGVDEIIAEIALALKHLNLQGVRAGFQSLTDTLANQTEQIAPQILYGICYTLIYLIGQQENLHNDEVKWSRSNALRRLMNTCRVKEDYLQYSGDLENKCVELLQRGRGYLNVIHAAKLYIRQNFHKKISLEDVARSVNHNASYFSRMFSKETGQSFTEYLTGVRVEHAKELLTDSDVPLSEISDLCGFNNQYYFSHTFKKSTGLAPGEWRRANRR